MGKVTAMGETITTVGIVVLRAGVTIPAFSRSESAK
jgi:uncharacterized membrane protein